MRKDSALDYAAYILLKLLGPVVRAMPLGLALFLGRRLGDLLYFFDRKHRAISYANLRTAFASEMSPLQLKGITRGFYRRFGQNLIEIFIIPRLDKDYIDKYITIENLSSIQEAFKKGKGVILLGVHEGSWELSNIICSCLGFPFSLFVRTQNLPRLNGLLNRYRSQKGCLIIERRNQNRQLIGELERNRAIGMTVDQGGKGGLAVDFFGREASMSTGAVKLALRYSATLVPAFYVRERGSHIRIILEPPFELQRTGDFKEDVFVNLQALVRIFEKHIRTYPQEYLWSYKIWKYSRQKRILVLTDSKTGHRRQTEALVSVTTEYLAEKGMGAQSATVEVKFKNRLSVLRCASRAWFCGRYACLGKLEGLKGLLSEDTYRTIVSQKPDIVISCGSSVAPLALIVSRENLSTSMVVMRPSLVSSREFDLCVIPGHDRAQPGKNTAVTFGALNLMTPAYLKRAASLLPDAPQAQNGFNGPVVGLLLGGESRDFSFSEADCAELIAQLKGFLEEVDGRILVTTSRRTSSAVEQKIKESFGTYPRCRLLVIPNEKHVSHSAGTILAHSTFAVVTPESISMLSEAASSVPYVLTFRPKRLGRKHTLFLRRMQEANFLRIREIPDLGKELKDLWQRRPPVSRLDDRSLVKQALRRIL